MFCESQNRAPGKQVLDDHLSNLEAQALYKGKTRPVFTRIAEHNNAIYVDLCNANCEAVEITAAGWAVVDEPPVRFRRTRGMYPLPEPERGGSLYALRAFVNVPDDDEFRLLLAWLVAALYPKGPYPILMLQGEQGSAKSTTARILRALVDPAKPPLRTTPRDERDFMIAATNSHVIALDNLSNLSSWISDALCRLSTGGGFATRRLHSNNEEVLFDAQRPVILNGIDDIATRHDLIERLLQITLPPISDVKRLDEATFWDRFEAVHPQILGALMEAMSEAMERLPSVRLSSSPRMADFARLGTAAELALAWPRGGFLAAYSGNRKEAVEVGLEASPIAVAIRALIDKEGFWKGTAAELFGKLTGSVGMAQRSSAWPKNGRALGSQLTRLKPALRVVGIEIERTKEGRESKRYITLRRTGEPDVRHVRDVRPSSPDGANRHFTADNERRFDNGSLSANCPPYASSPTKQRPTDKPDNADGNNHQKIVPSDSETEDQTNQIEARTLDHTITHKSVFPTPYAIR